MSERMNIYAKSSAFEKLHEFLFTVVLLMENEDNYLRVKFLQIYIIL